VQLRPPGWELGLVQYVLG